VSKKNKAIKIKWVDSCYSNGWARLDAEYDKEDIVVHTVGFVIDEDEETVTISSSVSGGKFCHSPLTIPKVAILNKKSVS